MNRIEIVSCGPGSPACVTQEAREAVRRASVLVGAQRLFALFPESVARCIAVRGHLREAIDCVEQNAAERVAVLVTGDAGVASLAQGLLKRFGRENCRVIAGISSVQVAFARLGVEWLDARIVNAHSTAPEISYERLAESGKIAVLAGSAQGLAWIAGLAQFLGDAWRMYRLCDLTLEEEQISEIERGSLGAETLLGRTILVFLRREQG